MKNRSSLFFVSGLIILATIGVVSNFNSSPKSLLTSIAISIVLGLAVYFVVRYFSNSNPEKREQRAFVKAAKRSKKRLDHKDSTLSLTKRSSSAITTMKKNLKPKKKTSTSAHLTVIEGNKGKKKNRASL